MDKDGPSSGPRKVRYALKAPKPSRKTKVTAARTETGDEEEEDATLAKHLLERFNENLAGRRRKVEKKSSPQVAFGPGAPSSTSLRSFGTQRDETSDKRTDSRQRSSDDNYGKIVATPKEDRTDIFSSDTNVAAAEKIKKEYREPWDFNTYYPITHPLRRPNSGDPELLDEAEFGEAANKEYDEDTINPAKDLGLLEESEKEKMYFFQLPPILPMIKPSASKKGKEKVENPVSSGRHGDLKKGCRLEELPAGYLGKMLVYKSGAVKLKLGETLYEVSPGSDYASVAQHVAVINTREKQCGVIGELGKKVVVDVTDLSFL